MRVCSKNVDSHLKPYHCKTPGCEDSKFSSTACLLRHEREAHGYHGYGERPHSCPYVTCDRHPPGSGFPRKWNLLDHQRRVHGDDTSNASGSPGSSSSTVKPVTGRKRKANNADAVARKRTVSTSDSGKAQSEDITMEPSLVERWQRRRLEFQHNVSRMHQPDGPNKEELARLRRVHDELTILLTMADNILQAPQHHAMYQQTG